MEEVLLSNYNLIDLETFGDRMCCMHLSSLTVDSFFLYLL